MMQIVMLNMRMILVLVYRMWSMAFCDASSVVVCIATIGVDCDADVAVMNMVRMMIATISDAVGYDDVDAAVVGIETACLCIRTFVY